ncbi:hypothetical protein HHI36_005886 [Cryptolaemus montrouzieri]|uniref:Uncharacterized protein n=1 Tax=Cryptolaemus montrouzieri TaxID=559131 RepID=A0ABD2NWC1_9CUCU
MGRKSVKIVDEGLVKAKNPHISPENAEKIERDQLLPNDEGTGRKPDEDTSLDTTSYTIDTEDPKHVKILHTSKKLHWSNILSNIILTQDHYFWRLILLCFLYTDGVVKLYQISFLKRHKVQEVLTLEIITDLLFFLNYICIITIHFWKRLHILLRHKRKGKIMLIFDGFLLIPYHIIYYLFTNEVKISSKYAAFAVISLLRLYYLEELFIEKSKNAGVLHWNYFVARYILLLFWFTHTIACILFLLACPFVCDYPTGWGYAVKTEEPNYIWYIFASYMAFMGLSNCGFGEYLATNHNERLVMSK